MDRRVSLLIGIIFEPNDESLENRLGICFPLRRVVYSCTLLGHSVANSLCILLAMIVLYEKRSIGPLLIGLLLRFTMTVEFDTLVFL